MTHTVARMSAVVTVATLLGSSVAACGGGIGTSGGIGAPIGAVLGQSCTDGTGPNSTTEEIVDAGQNTKHLILGDGNVYSRSELNDGIAGVVGAVAGLDLESGPSAADDYFASDTVPDGGDATFVDTVCSMHRVWAGDLPDSDVRRLAQTPHFIRSLGRRACADASSAGSAEKYLAGDRRYLAEFAQDPSGHQAAAITQMEANLRQLRDLIDSEDAGLPEDIDPDVRHQTREIQQKSLIMAEEFASELKSLTPDEILARFEEHLRFQEAAIQYQCPHVSQIGFGPECGDITYPNSRDTVGVIRIRSGNLSCTDARGIIENYFAQIFGGNQWPRLDPSTYAGEFQCLQTNFTITDDRYYYTSCIHPSEAGGVVVVPPTP